LNLARWVVPAAAVVWLVLLAAVIALPYLGHSPSLADDLTRNTVRLSLLYYAGAAALMTRLGSADWAARSAAGAAARGLWTLAWAALVVHLGMAFHHVHHWSHADAVEHTRQVSGVGEGVYVSHFFTLVWGADLVWWWLWPARYAARPAWVDAGLHGFMAFVIFNATVVFEEGWTRWGGVLLFLGLAALWLGRWFAGGQK
jgi:hypothetical protein